MFALQEVLALIKTGSVDTGLVETGSVETGLVDTGLGDIIFRRRDTHLRVFQIARG